MASQPGWLISLAAGVQWRQPLWLIIGGWREIMSVAMALSSWRCIFFQRKLTSWRFALASIQPASKAAASHQYQRQLKLRGGCGRS